MDGRPSRDKAEAREIRMRARLVDAVKGKVSRMEKEMMEISELMKKLFADDATDKVKNYTEEVCRRLQHEPGETNDVKTKDARTSGCDSRSSNVSDYETWKQTKFAEIGDTKPCSSTASSTQARVNPIPTKKHNAGTSRYAISSSQARSRRRNRINEARKMTEFARCRETSNNGCTTSSSYGDSQRNER